MTCISQSHHFFGEWNLGALRCSRLDKDLYQLRSDTPLTIPDYTTTPELMRFRRKTERDFWLHPELEITVRYGPY